MFAYENTPPTDLRTVEPNELVCRAHGGCADSYAELSRRFRPRLLHLLERRLGGGGSDAEDVVQEALAKAFQRLDRFDPRYRFSTWLYTIAIRLAHDRAKSRRRRPRQLALDEAHGIEDESHASRAADGQEEVDNVWQLAKRVLSDAQFAALWLRYGEDLPAAEVAQVMRRSRIGVRVLLSRARTRLADALVRHEPARFAQRLPDGGKG